MILFVVNSSEMHCFIAPLLLHQNVEPLVVLNAVQIPRLALQAHHQTAERCIHGHFFLVLFVDPEDFSVHAVIPFLQDIVVCATLVLDRGSQFDDQLIALADGEQLGVDVEYQFGLIRNGVARQSGDILEHLVVDGVRAERVLEQTCGCHVKEIASQKRKTERKKEGEAWRPQSRAHPHWGKENCLVENEIADSVSVSAQRVLRL
mmetsp:Transcript_1971/g.4146  ORF Transcript_1971/g.4146 Transcript_1971/m.4146 type:complete len:205 (-) Transcript_1971:104-718(-)